MTPDVRVATFYELTGILIWYLCTIQKNEQMPLENYK
jgi:hypothetical protein